MAEAKSIHAKLLNVQADLKVPKDLKNTFGNYRYRSAESILEAVKPHLKKQGLVIRLNDEVEMIGDRYYIKATVRLSDTTQNDSVEVTAYAREELAKKGMDSAQVTGAASSYARKYALNGMFAIDDTKDADATNDHKSKAVPPENAMHANQLKEVSDILEEKGITNRDEKITIIHAIAGDEPLRTSEVENLKKQIQTTEPDTLKLLLEN